jgi:hypothetical protein
MSNPRGINIPKNPQQQEQHYKRRISKSESLTESGSESETDSDLNIPKAAQQLEQKRRNSKNESQTESGSESETGSNEATVINKPKPIIDAIKTYFLFSKTPLSSADLFEIGTPPEVTKARKILLRKSVD